MDPIETLMNEHRLIESVLDALEEYTDRLAGNPATNAAHLASFADFIRAFADTCHHGKEEEILFDTMIQRGMPRQSGPIAVMLHEHEEGRQLVRALRDLAGRAVEPGWTDADRQRIRQTARSYADLLRQHIQKEDGILYPMALSMLDETARAEIARRFDAFESDPSRLGEHERLHALGEELIAIYGGSRATTRGEFHCH